MARGSAARPGADARPLVAEAFGTFALTFVAAGSDTFGALSGGAISPAARAVAPGLLVMALVYAIGDASGAHFNPAVSLAFALKRLFPARWLLRYWCAQLLGALAAAATLRLVFPATAAEGVNVTHVGAGPAVFIEAALACLLVTVILGTADRYRAVGPHAALAVGGTIALAGLVALPLEGASMNPARSLGPALVNGRVADAWIYLVGPVAGAALAVLITRFLHAGQPRDAKQREAAQGSLPAVRGADVVEAGSR